jgi:hypothetical protein
MLPGSKKNKYRAFMLGSLLITTELLEEVNVLFRENKKQNKKGKIKQEKGKRKRYKSSFCHTAAMPLVAPSIVYGCG